MTEETAAYEVASPEVVAVPEYKTIDGLITDEEADFLVELARSVPPRGLVVNIGTWHGKSVACFQEGQPAARIVTIDIDHSKITDKRPRVRYITKDSGAVALRWKRPIDLLFVDGSHSYDGAMADTKFAEHVKPGGKVVFHDYDAFMHECTWAIDDWWADHRLTYRKVAARGYIIVYEKARL